jgi:hypothetical protein
MQSNNSSSIRKECSESHQGSLMEKLKLGGARVSASVLSMVNNIKGQQPEHECGQQPEHEPVQHPQSRFLLGSPFSAAGPSDYGPVLLAASRKSRQKNWAYVSPTGRWCQEAKGDSHD